MATFASLLKSVQSAGEDFEWYPTTLKIIEVVARRLDKTKPDTSILDIGAGDGRVLTQLAEGFTGPYTSTPTLYAIREVAYPYRSPARERHTCRDRLIRAELDGPTRDVYLLQPAVFGIRVVGDYGHRVGTCP